MFPNLKKLRVNDCSERRHVMPYLIPLLKSASNLESIALSCNSFPFSTMAKMQSLREIRLSGLQKLDLDGLADCLEANTELKVFKIIDEQADLVKLGDDLSKSCKGLEQFKDRNFGNIYEGFCSAMANRYSFLSSLENLTSVKLTSFTFCGSDLYYPLSKLDGRKLVQLGVFMSSATPVILPEEIIRNLLARPLPSFPTLRSVKLEILDQNTEHYEPKWTQCDLRCRFLFHFLAQQKNIQRFTFNGGTLQNVHKVLDVVPNIRTLDISQTVLLLEEKGEIVPRVVDSLRKFRQSTTGNTEKHLLYLIVSYDFYRIEKERKNCDLDIIRIVFKSTKPF